MSALPRFESPCLEQSDSSFFGRLPAEIRNLIYRLYGSVDALVDGVSTKDPDTLFFDEDNLFDGDGLPLKRSCQRTYREMQQMVVKEVAMTFYEHWNFRVQLAVKGRLDWTRVQTIRIQLRDEDRYDHVGANFSREVLMRTKDLRSLHIDCTLFKKPRRTVIGQDMVVIAPEPEGESEKDPYKEGSEDYGSSQWLESLLLKYGTMLEKLERVVLDGKGCYPPFWRGQVREYVNPNVEIVELI